MSQEKQTELEIKEIEQKTNPKIVAARHIVGMLFVSCLNPFTLNGSQPILSLFSIFLFGIILASVIYGLLYLFFTKRAKKKGIKSFYLLAWAFILLALWGQWSTLVNS